MHPLLLNSAAAEAATMCVNHYEDLKAEESRMNKPSIGVFTALADDAERYVAGVMAVLQTSF